MEEIGFFSLVSSSCLGFLKFLKAAGLLSRFVCSENQERFVVLLNPCLTVSVFLLVRALHYFSFVKCHYFSSVDVDTKGHSDPGEPCDALDFENQANDLRAKHQGAQTQKQPVADVRSAAGSVSGLALGCAQKEEDISCSIDDHAHVKLEDKDQVLPYENFQNPLRGRRDSGYESQPGSPSPTTKSIHQAEQSSKTCIPSRS